MVSNELFRPKDGLTYFDSSYNFYAALCRYLVVGAEDGGETH